MTLFALAMISFVTERRGETRGSCRCLGTGPRNYGYRSNYYPGFARYEGVAEERKRPPSRADSRSVLLTVDEIDELSLSLSVPQRFAKRSSPHLLLSGERRIKNRDRKRHAFEKRKGKRRGKSRLITGVR